MKFVLVTDRALKDGYCALCCEAIRAEYLRDLDTRLSYCDHHCYSAHLRMSFLFKKTIHGVVSRVHRRKRLVLESDVPRRPAPIFENST